MHATTFWALITAAVSTAFGGANGFFDHKVEDIKGKQVAMSEYKGQVVMVVNTASKCGLTPQYAQLEALYRELKPKGFVVIGFPANNFGNQEPGSNSEIAQFCAEEYEVSFPMMAKVSVNGADRAPIYEWLISKSNAPTQNIRWNFEKFIIDRQGEVRFRFDPRTPPNDPKVREAIKSLLN